MSLTAAGASSSTWSSSSWEPSSDMVVCGRDPGRGKNTERLREWRREWRRLCFCGWEVEFDDVSGADIEVVIGNACMVGDAVAGGFEGNEDDSGEGSGGE